MAVFSGGIHHVTAITGDAQKNIDFYTQILGLRFVKLTVNFDDPSAYHLYYGDYAGSPGTIITFFAWQNASKGRIGAGETTAINLAIPIGSWEGFWRNHLTEKGIFYTSQSDRFIFTDPDGIELSLVERPVTSLKPAIPGSNVPTEFAVQHIESVNLASAKTEETRTLLRDLFGSEKYPSQVDASAGGRGSMGAGTIHHIAYRLPDDAAQEEWQAELQTAGFSVSPVMDRQYFHSIYFREPGGVLFELATDNPGFAVDEPVETLGQSLQLPPQYEAHRLEIERTLPPLRLPVVS